MKVALLTPTPVKPHPAYLDAIEASIPALDAAGYEHGLMVYPGNPYISYARAYLLHKALAWDGDVFVFIDHDLSWRPEDLVRLIETPDPVVAGTYRYKTDEEVYMGALFTDDDGIAETRADGCIRAHSVPAGFLKMTRKAVNLWMTAYPEFTFGLKDALATDLFNHGVIDGTWYGEDMAFSRRWLAKCGDIWLIPDLELTHHAADKAFPGNLHEFLLRQPGGSKALAA